MRLIHHKLASVILRMFFGFNELKFVKPENQLNPLDIQVKITILSH